MFLIKYKLTYLSFDLCPMSKIIYENILYLILWKNLIFRKTDQPNKISVSVIETLTRFQRSSRKVGSTISDPITVNSVPRHDDSLSSILFNIVLEKWNLNLKGYYTVKYGNKSTRLIIINYLFPKLPVSTNEFFF